MAKKQWIPLLLILALLLTMAGCGSTESSVGAERSGDTLAKTAQWLLEQNPAPGLGPIGGEWLILGLARSGAAVPERYYDSYYETLCSYVRQVDGVLDARKYTEYSRVILALTAIGRDPANVAGYNLLEPLADFEQTTFQGINGPVYALLALDSGEYELPTNQSGNTQATRQLYVEYILSKELTDGGWSFAGGEAEIDITAMTLQALAKYQENPKVKAAIDRALTILSKQQNENGGYTAYDDESSESICQVIVALMELGIALDDDRFQKNGHSLLDRLLAFSTDEGGFRHLIDSDVDFMPSEQALYALAAVQRAKEGKSTLYSMADVTVS